MSVEKEVTYHSIINVWKKCLLAIVLTLLNVAHGCTCIVASRQGFLGGDPQWQTEPEFLAGDVCSFGSSAKVLYNYGIETIRITLNTYM